jgi:hypothetical protein
LLFFWIVRNSNKGLIASYSNMEHPCYNRCKIVSNYTTFLFLFLAIPLNLGNNIFMAMGSKQFLFLACKLWNNTNPLSSYQFPYYCHLSYNMHAYKEKPT